MDEEKEKMKTGKKLVIALIMILLILTAGAYGGNMQSRTCRNSTSSVGLHIDSLQKKCYTIYHLIDKLNHWRLL